MYVCMYVYTHARTHTHMLRNYCRDSRRDDMLAPHVNGSCPNFRSHPLRYEIPLWEYRELGGGSRWGGGERSCSQAALVEGDACKSFNTSTGWRTGLLYCCFTAA